MTEEKAIVKNLKINYKTFGSKEARPMLLLHGWGSNSDRWIKTAELLAAANFYVFIPDLPGFGKSQEPTFAWSTDDYVDWMSQFLEAVGLNQEFYLAGHSFGGNLAAKFCIRYVQKVTKLFLISSSCIRIKTPSKKLLYNISRTVKLFYFLPYYQVFRKYFYRIFLRKSDYPFVSGVMKETYLKVIGDDLSQKLAFIKIPVAIIWGDKDDLTPIEHAKIIHEKIEHSKLVIIEGATHALNIKIPEILAEKIIQNS